MNGLRRAIMAAALMAPLWLAAAGAAAAQPLSLEQLMQALATVKSGEAKFTERRRILTLDQTLESSGRLAFTAPDVFVRETLKPRHEKLAVNGNQLTMSLGSRQRSVQLDTVPEAQVMIEAIRGTLTGNGATLQRHFSTSLDGSLDHWALTLQPREPRLRGLVARIDIAGEHAKVLEVRLLMSDGDTSVMQIQPQAAGTAQ